MVGIIVGVVFVNAAGGGIITTITQCVSNDNPVVDRQGGIDG
jgi:hypothetical protein